MKKIIAVFSAFLTTFALQAQITSFPNTEVSDNRHTVFAFTNAHIQVDAETVIDKGTLLIKDGLVLDVGPAVTVPAGAVVTDMQGKWIYPSFIDPYSTYGMPEVKRRQWNDVPQYTTNRPGPYAWNDGLKPETEAIKSYAANAETAGAYRNLGFGSVMTFSRDGIARGTSACVSLNAEDGDNSTILKDKAAACYSFSKGTSSMEYPSSLMGAIALLRQTYADADWYKNDKAKQEYNIGLESWNMNQLLPQIFETSDKWNVLRADKIGDEFKVQYIFKGSGNEYQRMDEMKATRGSFILPLNFPEAFDVEDPYDAELISYEDLKHWELAPLNPGAFEKYQIPFALTASDLKDKKVFWANLRKAIQYGLTEKGALKALTATPAQMLGIGDKVGALKKGMHANFLIVSGNVFAEKSAIYENWVRGHRYILSDYNAPDLRGTYTLRLSNGSAERTLRIAGEAHKLKANFMKGDSAKESVSVNVLSSQVTISYQLKGEEGATRLAGSIDAKTKNILGRGQLPDGTWIGWTATFQSAFVPEVEKPDSTKYEYPTLDDVIYPFSAYGVRRSDTAIIERLKHRYDAILIKNITVWTNEKDSILPDMDVYIVDGKIVRIAKNIDAPKGAFAMVIDGTGKHLTAGIIDEHSHIAVSGGVNEAAQMSSAEVRIGDVLNPDDVNIYRQLAGGVTASQLLHGSANPIGGQSALVKLRWGANAEGMKIEGAQGFIKFALGENVKQSNWGDNYRIRFPQSRMGVEQVYYDYFTRAKEYNEKWQAWKALPQKEKEKASAPRRDLELETLVEILAHTRFITCHSYVQSEINMLMHVADSMGFQVNTFTHILEGYKVADKMKAHGAGGSSFSDWWSYKYEVKDAIPYNAAIMTRMGIIVSINSDDAEMARRLNQEAAKSVKYGGLTEEQALKLVTLNPAKLLRLDKRMGSIAVGKDADVVIWSDNPLSIYARPEKTIVDGKVLYDTEEDAQRRVVVNQDRNRLIQLMINEKNGGAAVRKAPSRKPKLWDCEDFDLTGDYLDDSH
ncbi:MAG: amidohydrolase family protein [Bacteroidia bacterium]